MKNEEKEGNMTKLEKYAEYEMKRAGLYDKDADYGGMIPEAVMNIVRAYGKAGHSSCGSHALTMAIFNKVIEFKPLTPLTTDPSEWNEVIETRNSIRQLWQNRRDREVFSEDGGKTAYHVSGPGTRRPYKLEDRKVWCGEDRQKEKHERRETE